MERKRVLIIGETGVGKSATTNVIVGRNVAEASNTARSVTFATTKYPWGNFDLFDTVGYNGVAETKPTEALVNLAKFALDVNSNGISLIVYVMRMGRINDISKQNYDYFVKTVCKSQVPVLLVVTHCEEEAVLGRWYASEQPTFIEYGMVFADSVCGSTVDLTDPNLDQELVPIYARKRARTQDVLRKKIEGLALAEPWKPTNFREWILPIFFGAIVILAIGAAAVVLASPTLLGLLGAGIVGAINAFKR